MVKRREKKMDMSGDLEICKVNIILSERVAQVRLHISSVFGGHGVDLIGPAWLSHAVCGDDIKLSHTPLKTTTLRPRLTITYF